MCERWRRSVTIVWTLCFSLATPNLGSLAQCAGCGGPPAPSIPDAARRAAGTIALVWPIARRCHDRTVIEYLLGSNVRHVHFMTRHKSLYTSCGHVQMYHTLTAGADGTPPRSAPLRSSKAASVKGSSNRRSGRRRRRVLNNTHRNSIA